MEYQEINGISYDIEADDRVIEILEDARKKKYRIRLFYGNKVSGEDWLEDGNTIGYISNSPGGIKLPVLLSTLGSKFSISIMEANIVRIKTTEHELYRHPNYHIPDLHMDAMKGLYCWRKGNTIIICFPTKLKADNWKKYIFGERMVR